METYYTEPKYQDRESAGHVLAEKLQPFRNERLQLLAIPNGGVAVGLPIAAALNCPLHLMVVRKLQIPNNPEAI